LYLVVTFSLERKSNQKEGDPGLPPLRGTLDQPQASGAAQLDLAGRTPRAPLRDSNSARLNLRFLTTDRGGAQGMKSGNPKPKKQMGNKLPTLCSHLRASVSDTLESVTTGSFISRQFTRAKFRIVDKGDGRGSKKLSSASGSS